MPIKGIEGYQPMMRITERKRKISAGGSDEEVTAKAQVRDEVTISAEGAEHCHGSLVGREETDRSKESQNDDAEGDEQADIEYTESRGSVGINALKLARMLAAAKTRSQVQAVIDKIEADLKECDEGKERGWDVDEESVKAAKHLLQQAKSRLNSAEDREATPEEEMASSLASLI